MRHALKENLVQICDNPRYLIYQTGAQAFR